MYEVLEEVGADSVPVSLSSVLSVLVPSLRPRSSSLQVTFICTSVYAVTFRRSSEEMSLLWVGKPSGSALPLYRVV